MPIRLQLRYAMRMSGKEPVLAGNIIKDILENDRPVLVGYDFNTIKLESACMWPSANGFTNNSVSWSFREHNGLRMGSNIWHQFSSDDDPEGYGIFDPRAFIFFEGDSGKILLTELIRNLSDNKLYVKILQLFFRILLCIIFRQLKI